jgi:hypothetical protein
MQSNRDRADKKEASCFISMYSPQELRVKNDKRHSGKLRQNDNAEQALIQKRLTRQVIYGSDSF